MSWFLDRVALRSSSRPALARTARRWLLCAVAVEMVVAGLAVPAISGGTAGRSASFDSTGTAVVTEERRAAPRSQRAAASSWRAIGKPSDSKAGGAVGASEAARPTPNEHADAAARGISFKAPIDFATGAVPSSAAFNVAHGDQMPLPATRATPLTDSVVVGDFNHDGNPDVAQTNVLAGTVSIFLGDGRGGFAPPQQHTVGVNPVFVVAGDLDLDGNLDLAVANYGSNDVAILHGDGDDEGSFQPAFFVPVPTPRNIAIGEFNGDGIPDLAVASIARAMGPITLPVGGVAILTGNKGGGFSPAQFFTPTAHGRPVGANYVAAGDFDGKGFDDLAIGVGTSPNAGARPAGSTQPIGDDVLIYLNRNQALGATPEHPFSESEQQRIRVGGLPNAISVADLNADGHSDLAVLNGSSGHLTTLLGDGEGHFVLKVTNSTVGAIPFALAAGDFNDDGLVDLVTANWFSSTVSVLQGNGDGTFRPAVDFWSGDATTSAAVGDFNDDGRVDIVAARLRNDHLALLVNESPQRGDGVVITRDIAYYGGVDDDPFAAHHTLDVYSPPKGTPSFAGRGSRYPVVLFAHPGGSVTGDKSMVSYLMRSLALEGLVAVSIDYRLNERPGQPDEDQVKDIAQAFRWTRDNIGSTEYGGDPGNIFVSGSSAGANLLTRLTTDKEFIAEQQSIRGLVVLGAGALRVGDAPRQPPSLLLNGDEGEELRLSPVSTAFVAVSQLRGAESTQVIVPGRDHMTIVSRPALPGDPGRVAWLDFMRTHVVESR